MSNPTSYQPISTTTPKINHLQFTPYSKFSTNHNNSNQISNTINHDLAFKKAHTLNKIPTLQDEKIQNYDTQKKKLFKNDKIFTSSSAKEIGIDHHSFDFYAPRKQEQTTDLRTTCPNVVKKFDQTNLRNTTHGNSKIGSIIADVRKNQQQELKKMKKNSGIIETYHTTKQEHVKTTQLSQNEAKNDKTKYRSLNDMWGARPNKVSKPKKNLINGFEIHKQLGKGKFGQVYLARHIQTGFVVALKKIIKAKMVQYKMLEQFKRQIRLHSALDHPNIVRFYGFFEHGECIYLILEYISGGTLFDYLNEKQTLSPHEAAEYLKDTIEALSYMHEKSIAHRDIKPQNIVMTAEKVAKLCDFGWSALVQSSRTTYCGTFDYAPPEVLQRKNYDIAVDIWCIGVLTFELLTGRVPFEGDQRKQIKQKILSVDKTKIIYPINIPDDAKNFIQLLVQKDPNQRPKCRDLLKHPFFINNLKNQPNPKKA